MSAGPRLIVNVDDLGLHPAVRRAVEACAAQGTVTLTSATPAEFGSFIAAEIVRLGRSAKLSGATAN